MRIGGQRLIATAAAVTLALSAAGCGDDSSDDPGAEGGGAPGAAASFPALDGRDLDGLLADVESTELVVSPAGEVYAPGRNRFAFGVFTVAREQITDAEIAIYASPASGGPAQGPFPARVESLETEPAFTARTTADDPDSAKVVYVTDLVLERPGEWRLLALVREGDDLAATRIPSIVVERSDPVPAPGERAPNVHTPTADDVGGDIAKIDTRVPHSTMHDADLADALGKQPVVLLFATPALCQSRVCGPVVDVAEQVKREHGDDAAFIYMEIYEDNDPNAGLRPQVRSYGLPTEPWLFVIDRKGRVDTRIEGAFSVAELERAVERVIR